MTAMTARKATAVTALAISALLSSCTRVDASDPRAAQVEARNDQGFLGAIDPSLRQKFGDAVLVAEARKVCDELDRGVSEDDVAAMVKKDLDTDPVQFNLYASITYCPVHAPG